ncbi:MAG: 3',5'-cyclic-AMP phosphodiesterase [Psychromonas sp.]|nr:3',5'-cyclic-AMP phosphodiesterase [Psychromonas sp.]
MKIDTVNLQGHPNGDVSFLQITDTHLFEDKEETLIGIKTFSSFNAVIDHALKYAPSSSAVLATGDISQDQSINSYLQFGNQINRFLLPCYSLPGNHDNHRIMKNSLLTQGILHPQLIESEFWTIILLDSNVTDQPHGFLSETNFEFLEQFLAEEASHNSVKNVLICIHHHILKVGSKWLDEHILINRKSVLSLIKKHNFIKAVLSGHVHQESDVLHNGVRFMTTPSTCVQFKANSPVFTTDSKAPGYRHLVLRTSGKIDTRVLRIPSGLFDCDKDHKGY